MKANYCSQCGNRIDDGAKFCKYCGSVLKAVGSPPPPPLPGKGTPPPLPVSSTSPEPPPLVSSDESILAVVPVQLRENLVIFKHYLLIVTAKRVIFARLLPEVQKEIARQASEEAKANGKGMFGRFMAAAGSGRRIYDRYFAMPPEDILAESSDNFFVNNQEVNEIRYKESRFGTGSDGNDRVEKGKIIIKSSRGKHTMEAEAFPEEQEFRNLLSELFPGKVKRNFLF